MTPATATAMVVNDVSSSNVLAPEWLAEASEGGTYFEPAALVGSYIDRGLYVPVYSPAFHLGPIRDDPSEAISTHALFVPPEPAAAPTGESGDTASPSTAAWIKPIVERFDELVALPPNWDHHGADPIDPHDLLSAFRFLRNVMQPNTPPPAVIPSSGGGVQLEWHVAGLDVEVSVVDQSAAELYVYDIGVDREWEGTALPGFAEHRLAERLAE